MIRQCAWCNQPMGEKPPFEDKSITHGICRACLRKQAPSEGITQYSHAGVVHER